MLISQLIEKLQEVQVVHGDIKILMDVPPDPKDNIYSPTRVLTEQ